MINHHHLILRVVTKLLVGAIILFAFYVQFHGDFSPGGGFQAGVLMAAAFIIYGLVFGLDKTQEVLPPWVVHKLSALGVLIYSGTGVWSMMLGYPFLDYGAFDPGHPSHGQHTGILAVEAGVGLTVAAVMVTIYYGFGARYPHISDEDW
ncbi:Na(+)/H(+) antiporter subunit B [Alphaproteobacteria bacterium KMM 3653]|uniref:Na(+)/H(+) antiporter subunit B n=1 Tax=Harenicola maris TaxID=2841044 RepID=A0AAP2CVW7_9RHOB|nr:Na(+)/H(+) antiporter subunit B [Harenicola maris]